MRTVFLIFASLLFCFTTLAQPKIEFRRLSHDFGTFNEDKTFVYHDFKFKNTGDTPLLIINAKSSCSCSVPEYTKAPIAPGAEGVISVKYSAIGRPGAFNKAIKIITNAENAETNLIIKGNVIAAADNDEYKYFINGLKLKTVNYDMGNIVKGGKKSLSFDTKNGTDRPLKMTISNVPTHIRVEAMPADLKPGERGVIKVTFDAGVCNDWGRGVDEFLISSERPESRTMNKKISIAYNITEDFSKQGNNHPAAKIERVLVDFGERNSISVASNSIKLQNLGNGNLVVRKVSSSSPVVSAKIDNDNIKAGGEATVTININPTKSKTRIVNESVTIVTNDRKNSEIKVQVTAVLK